MPTIQIDDIAMNFEIAGEGPPLLFLHGLGSSGRDWALQVDHFRRTCRTITCDMRGHGRSDKPPGPYSIARFAADVSGLLASLNAVPAHVVGLSMGGSVAFQLAVDYPETLRSMIIVNSAPAVIPETLRQRLQVWLRLAMARFLSVRQTGVYLSKRLFPNPEDAQLREMFVERWAENDPKAYRAAMRALVGWSVADRLETIMIPTLVIAAEHDYTPVAHKERYVARMPRAQLLVMPGSRHATPIDSPDMFNSTLEHFLASIEPVWTPATAHR